MPKNLTIEPFARLTCNNCGKLMVETEGITIEVENAIVCECGVGVISPGSIECVTEEKTDEDEDQ